VGSDGKPLYNDLMLQALQVAHWQFGKQTDATLEELAVEIMVGDQPRTLNTRIRSLTRV